jgi:hypothetical protein
MLKEFLVGNPKRKGTTERRLEDHVKIDHTKIGLKDVDRIHLAQDRDQQWALVNTLMNLQVT